ncbi:phosphate ABC transporter permease [Haloarcula salina]|uniref:Phosphate ABC transporter permease n=1 Tax=Haloarcula salina TaxID=1429914 RepID=A0AA41KJ29_9EURY|nr:phosphate ABC transporter permease [Haloarcula salina]MBV0903446.1 phosphate ABC transporter permease [Haloarcula salina]
MTATALRTRVRPLLGRGDRSVTVAATGIAALAVAVQYVVVLLVNAPGRTALPVASDALAVGSTAVVALAAVALAVTRSDAAAGTGLLFVGVFGLLALLDGAAALPAAVAAVAGTTAVAAASGRTLDPLSAVATALLLAALSVGLASGVAGWTGLRPLASTVALVGIAALPAFAASDWRARSKPDWAAMVGGLFAFAAVVAVGRAVPFVTGAVTLTGSGVVGTSLPVVALAVAGAVTAASAATRTGRWTLLAGVALVAFAGVPASLPRALPFALGTAALALEEGHR